MKTENFYLAQTYATNLNLKTSKDYVSVEKIRDYIKNSPDILKVLLEYIKEIDSLFLSVGDAVVCEDKKRRLVTALLWEHKEGETKITKAELIDMDGYKQVFLIEKIKKLK